MPRARTYVGTAVQVNYNYAFIYFFDFCFNGFLFDFKCNAGLVRMNAGPDDHPKTTIKIITISLNSLLPPS